MARQLPMMEKEDFMIQSRTPQYIKIEECNHVEKTLLSHLDWPCRGIIALLQNLLNSEKRVTALFNKMEVALS